MLILPISRSWIISRTAERVYLWCAILSLALSGTWIGTRAAQVFAGYHSLSPGIATLLRLVFFAEAVGAALLSIAMIYFWFGFDQSSWLKKALWLFFLWLGLPFLWAMYYFFVYRCQLRNQRQTSAGVSAHS